MEKLAEDTLVFHQLHKRVWPSTQRESLFCSHLCTLPSAPRPENMVGQTWMVCNFSTDHDNVPPNSKLIRITLHVGMVCQTITDTPVEVGQEADLRRDNVSCRIIYAANGEYPHSVNRNTSVSHCWGVCCQVGEFECWKESCVFRQFHSTGACQVPYHILSSAL